MRAIAAEFVKMLSSNFSTSSPGTSVELRCALDAAVSRCATWRSNSESKDPPRDSVLSDEVSELLRRALCFSSSTRPEGGVGRRWSAGARCFRTAFVLTARCFFSGEEPAFSSVALSFFPSIFCFADLDAPFRSPVSFLTFASLVSGSVLSASFGLFDVRALIFLAIERIAIIQPTNCEIHVAGASSALRTA